ncbi:MAG: hypothetical protein JEZ07_03125 [Phycisphaerae bacterium]|nr:hypothetical protein [Phycisphaerae bacterium]
MNQYLLKFEQACLDSTPEALLVIGIGCIVIGLFLWLGGTRYSWLVAGIVGSAIGLGAGLLICAGFDTQTLPTILISIAVGAGIAILLQNVIIITLAVAIFAVSGGTAYLGYLLNNPDEQAETTQQQDFKPIEELTEKAEETVKNGLIVEKIEEFNEKGGMKGLLLRVKEVGMEITNKASKDKGLLALFTAIGAVLGLIIALMVLKWIVLALCCSIVGSAVLILGTIMALMFKGATPITSMINDPKLLPSIFFFMVAFGWTVQMLLAGPLRQKESAKKVKNEDEDK